MEIIGYVFDRKGGCYKDKYYFEYTAEKIAIFITQNNRYAVTITTKSDELICSSFPGGFIDYCSDQMFLQEELLPTIIKLQNGEKYKAIEFEEVECRIMKEKRIKI